MREREREKERKKERKQDTEPQGMERRAKEGKLREGSHLYAQSSMLLSIFRSDLNSLYHSFFNLSDRPDGVRCVCVCGWSSSPDESLN